MLVSFTEKDGHTLPNLCAPHYLFVIQPDDTDDEGEWSNYVIIYAIISFFLDWQMVGI